MNGKRPLGRLKYRYDVIKTDLREGSLSHCNVNESGELRIGGFGVSLSSIQVNEFLYHLSACHLKGLQG
jgi:hypothetical protein